jgi:hypothetical protein
LHEKYVVDSIGNLPRASQFTTRTRPINKVVGLIVPRAISSMPFIAPNFMFYWKQRENWKGR